MTAGRKLRLVAILAIAILGGVARSAVAQPSSFITTAGCQEHQAFVDGDATAVAARLPKHYSAVRDAASGRPLLFARALRCQSLTLDGRTAPATMASFGVVIDSPDGKGCASRAPLVGPLKGDVPPLCNWYTLFWLADDPRVIHWLRDGTPGFPAVYVPHLVFDLGAFDPARGGAPFHFQAPAPAPSPFTIDEIGRERPGEISARGGYWVDTRQGTVKLAFSTDDITTGDATGAVRATPGSQMAALFGADEQSYAAGYTLISAERWGHLTYRKQLLGPPRPEHALDSFAGSCSVQGTNTFQPPVTNTQQTLDLSYDGTGTCSGTLDGRNISNAPVQMHNTGQSDGSCPHARTLAPAQGAIRFVDGTTIRYTFDFTFVLSEGDITWYGERSGSANGHGSFLTQRSPPDITLKCSGEGEPELPLDFTLTTDSPLVSERRTGRDAASSSPGAAGAPLKLSVRPRHALLGRRTSFAFRVFTADGRSAPGVLIRFAGRRAHTGRRGAAIIVTTLHRSGRWAARATKSGFGMARATVRVRR